MERDSKNQILEAMRSYFRSKGITQYDIAQAIGKAQSYINIIMNGKVSISPAVAEMLSEQYGFSTVYLTTGFGGLFGEETQEQPQQTSLKDVDQDVLVRRLLDELIEERKRSKALEEELKRLKNED